MQAMNQFTGAEFRFSLLNWLSNTLLHLECDKFTHKIQGSKIQYLHAKKINSGI